MIFGREILAGKIHQIYHSLVNKLAPIFRFKINKIQSFEMVFQYRFFSFVENVSDLSGLICFWSRNYCDNLENLMIMPRVR